ncbi:hypothetical protein [Sagittula sp. S175]|uniref:hypothetical protein n=1 Tax=Sagittula sp. S175 TaxID=3415129 RepID=UPI003C7A4EE9
MRKLVVALFIGLIAAPVLAEDELDKCAQTEAWFNLAVDSRKLGETKAAVRRTLRPDMGREAADQLVDFVFALPDEHLNHELGAAARKQCEGL